MRSESGKTVSGKAAAVGDGAGRGVKVCADYHRGCRDAGSQRAASERQEKLYGGREDGPIRRLKSLPGLPLCWRSNHKGTGTDKVWEESPFYSSQDQIEASIQPIVLETPGSLGIINGMKP